MSSELYDDIGNKHSGTAKELASLFVGKELGRGSFRTVYCCPYDASIVLKYEGHAGDFSNILEWETWNKFKDTKFAAWLAPCLKISPCGTILIQERTEPLPKHLRPKKTPFFLSDFKTANWGLLRGMPVCHDYALLADVWPVKDKQFLKTDWYD